LTSLTAISIKTNTTSTTINTHVRSGIADSIVILKIVRLSNNITTINFSKLTINKILILKFKTITIIVNSTILLRIRQADNLRLTDDLIRNLEQIIIRRIANFLNLKLQGARITFKTSRGTKINPITI